MPAPVERSGEADAVACGAARSGWSSRSSDVVLTTTGLLGVAGLGYGWAYDASGGTFGLPCPVAATTGILCPMCGTTRMLAALAHGDVAAAVEHNALTFVLGLVVAYVWVAWSARRFGLARLPLPRWRGRVRAAAASVLAAAAVGFMVVRNLFGG